MTDEEQRQLLIAIANYTTCIDISLTGSQDHNEELVRKFLERNNIKYTEDELDINGWQADYHQNYNLPNNLILCVACSGYYGGGSLYLEQDED